MAVRNKIGQRLQRLRGKRTQQEVAEALGVKRETIAQWENETRRIKDADIIELAEYYHCSCDYILRGIKAEDNDIHEITGLSGKAIDTLNQHLRRHSLMINFINFIIEQEYIPRYYITDDGVEHGVRPDKCTPILRPIQRYFECDFSREYINSILGLDNMLKDTEDSIEALSPALTDWLISGDPIKEHLAAQVFGEDVLGDALERSITEAIILKLKLLRKVYRSNVMCHNPEEIEV